MRKTPYGFGKVQEQQLRHLHRQFEEIYKEEEEEEELNLAMPSGHPLNRIPTIEERIGALETKLTTIEEKIDQTAMMVQKVGDMVHYMWRIVMKAEKQAEAKPRLFVPGGN